MLSDAFFRKLGFDIVKKFKRHIWKGSKDVYGAKFKEYKSQSYKERKNAGKIKRQSAESRGSRAPIVTGDFKNDFKLLSSSSSGISLGWSAHGSKVKWLADNKRVVTADDQPLPDGLLRMIDSAIKKETERQLPKNEVVHIKVGK